jgi:hypothetical protein
VAAAAPQHSGLYAKYRVTHPGSDSELLDTFVLRPSRDPHARAALAAYAAETTDLALAADLYQWLGHIARAEATGGTADFPLPPHAVAALRQRQVDADAVAGLPVHQPAPAAPVLPEGARLTTCGTCGAQIFFGCVRKKDGTYSGARSPFDWPTPAGGGHMLYVGGAPGGLPGFAQVTDAVRAEARAAYLPLVLYSNHFTTCPSADRHRRG